MVKCLLIKVCLGKSKSIERLFFLFSYVPGTAGLKFVAVDAMKT